MYDSLLLSHHIWCHVYSCCLESTYLLNTNATWRSRAVLSVIVVQTVCWQHCEDPILFSPGINTNADTCDVNFILSASTCSFGIVPPCMCAIRDRSRRRKKENMLGANPCGLSSQVHQFVTRYKLGTNSHVGYNLNWTFSCFLQFSLLKSFGTKTRRTCIAALQLQSGASTEDRNPIITICHDQ